MDRALLTSLQQAGVKESVISIIEDEEFDTVEILNNTSDDLLKSCNIKGGQIVRIRNALSAEANEDLEVFQIVYGNQSLGHQTEDNFLPLTIPPSTPSSSQSSTPAQTPPCTPHKPSTSSSSFHTPSLGRIPPEVESPGQTPKPSPGFAIKEKRAANINWVKDYKLPQSFSPKVHEELKDGKLSGNRRDEFTRDIVSSIKVPLR